MKTSVRMGIYTGIIPRFVEFFPRLISLHGTYIADYQSLLINNSHSLLLEQFFHLFSKNKYKLSIIKIKLL